MSENLKKQFEEIKQLKGDKREEALLTFAGKYNYPQAYNELGVFYKDKKSDYVKAVEMFQKALEIKKDATVYTNLATCYYMLSCPDTPEREAYMKKTVEAFEASARMNSASYFFLGNLYMPGSNAPFPDDQELANSYFMKIEKDKKYFFANGMKAIGTYYYKDKKDFPMASAYLYLAKNADPKDKKMANYYELVFGKVTKRKFWEEQFQRLISQNDVERVVREAREKLTIRCPRCGSTECQKISVMTNVRKMLEVSFGIKRLEKYAKTYECRSCKYEW